MNNLVKIAGVTLILLAYLDLSAQINAEFLPSKTLETNKSNSDYDEFYHDPSHLDKASAPAVIILEAPIIINDDGTEVPFPTECDCDYSSADYLDIDDNTFTWDMLIGENYLIHLKYASNEFSKFTLSAVSPEADSHLPMQFILTCAENINFAAGTNTLYGPGDSEETAIQMAYGHNFYFKVTSETNPIIGGKLYTCINTEGEPSNRLGMTDESSTPSIALFPNPVREMLSINLHGAKNTPSTIQVIDQLNRVMLTKSITDPQVLEINTADWPAGQYYLLYKTTDTTETSSFIKLN